MYEKELLKLDMQGVNEFLNAFNDKEVDDEGSTLSSTSISRAEGYRT